jgi:poly-gamma-glutamate synthesis protein (capsule biosynthesis protein)
MRIVIGADFVPSEQNEQLFIDGKAEEIVGKEIYDIIKGADLSIFNLEIPLTDHDSPIKKSGVAFRADPGCIRAYLELGVDVLGISNNHVLDHGLDGFKSTLATIDASGIARVGGGFTQEEASKPLVIERCGKKIGIYACCEHEFSWVSDYGFGANGFDPLESLDEIAALKAECDYVIVLYHGGKEHYPYPSPYLRRVCRKIAEKGADIVLCQHTHCIGAEEDWKGSKIIYGQGNFVFVKNREEYPFPLWFSGMLVAVDIDGGDIKYDYIPYKLNEVGVEISDDPELLGGFRQRSEEIQVPGFVEDSFAEYAANTINSRYIKRMVGHPVDDEFVLARGRAIFSYMECEVHREMLITGLRKKLGLGIYGEFPKEK